MALRIAGTSSVVFVHLQKTGGTWVRKALEDSGLSGEEIGKKHSPISDVLGKLPEATVFGFVRDPFMFLRSYFMHRDRGVWYRRRELDRVCRATSFQVFLDKYLENLSGWVTRWYLKYLEGASFVGKVELLPQDLFRALDLVGVPYDQGIVSSTPRQNVAPAKQRQSSKLGELEQRYRQSVYEAERGAYDRWGYSRP